MFNQCKYINDCANKVLLIIINYKNVFFFLKMPKFAKGNKLKKKKTFLKEITG